MSSISSGVFGRDGLLGLDSTYFDLVFSVREALEVSAQCFQLHRFSELVARRSVSHSLLVLLVLNCWSSLLLHRLFRGRLALGRVACLTIDLALNMVASMALPMIVFLPYALMFDVETFSLPVEVLYNDVMSTTLVLENRAVFALSWADGVSKLIPHIATLSTLRSLRVVFLEARTSTVRPSHQAAHDIVPGSAVGKPTKQQRISHTPLTRRLLNALPSVLHLAFVVLSVVIIVLHTRAFATRGRDSIEGCKQAVHPWFGSTYTCAIYEYNCYRRGVDSPPEDVLESLDRDSLVVLIFTHCPSLRVPRAIRRFPRLLGLQIWNATLVQWTADASIDAAIHSWMTYLVLARVNMTTLPDGMLQPLPDMLLDIELSVTNLTALPDDLHERWHDLTVLYIEHAQLSEFPRALLHLAVDDLSLCGQQIETIPALAGLTHSYFVLTLAGNPLRALPATIQPEVTFGFVVLDDTLLSSAPLWLLDQVLIELNLHGTPLCLNATHEATSLVDQRLARACEARALTADGRFPLALATGLRQP
ncbi:hypothetical protein P43SY_005420 [Pythium insidiosum]|uniref:Uncharacterized protein n=1 Tax=Pythium insidiosum TaxID=114742 RepID=A0AAD5LAM1_PYTIN|nr:hypothetical protein P43SY_005420 [Pythium insidiosum]